MDQRNSNQQSRRETGQTQRDQVSRAYKTRAAEKVTLGILAAIGITAVFSIYSRHPIKSLWIALLTLIIILVLTLSSFQCQPKVEKFGSQWRTKPSIVLGDLQIILSWHDSAMIDGDAKAVSFAGLLIVRAEASQKIIVRIRVVALRRN
jgi:hypothetical protein